VILLPLLFAAATAATLPTPDLTCRVREKASGALVRSAYRKHLFWRMTGYPTGRPGYAVDHIVPLACGGCDLPSNMEWLTISEWRAKSLWERRPCSSWWEGDFLRRIIVVPAKNPLVP